MNLGAAATRVKNGATVTLVAVGGSMTPRIRSGDTVTIQPIRRAPQKNDVVLVRVNRRWMLHLVSALSQGRVQISNNHGRVNGWTAVSNVVGIVELGGDHEPRLQQPLQL